MVLYFLWWWRWGLGEAAPPGLRSLLPHPDDPLSHTGSCRKDMPRRRGQRGGQHPHTEPQGERDWLAAAGHSCRQPFLYSTHQYCLEEKANDFSVPGNEEPKTLRGKLPP